MNVFTSIKFVDNYIDSHQSSSWIIIYKMMFGMHIDDQSEERLFKKKIIYNSLLVLLMFTC